MRIRLEGTPVECDRMAKAIGAVLTVVAASEPRANRGESQLVRVYLDIRLNPPERPLPPA